MFGLHFELQNSLTANQMGFDTIEINLVLHTNDFLLPPTETQCQQYLSFY